MASWWGRVEEGWRRVRSIVLAATEDCPALKRMDEGESLSERSQALLPGMNAGLPPNCTAHLKPNGANALLPRVNTGAPTQLQSHI